MRIEDIPQEPSILEGRLRACYAKNAAGRYELATSQGWEVERIANQLAVAAVNAHIKQALADVRAGKSSALAYHMARAHMDARLLAAHSGFWVWQVRRHLKPMHFEHLTDRVLSRYANALGIDLATLTGKLPV